MSHNHEINIYYAVNVDDTEDRFEIRAPSIDGARATLIEKLGFVVIEDEPAQKFFLVECDDNGVPSGDIIPLRSKTFEEAYQEVLKAAHWEIRDDTVVVDYLH